MESFLLTLLVITIAEMGDRSQLLCAVLSMRFHQQRQIISGLVLATLFNCFISAYLGSTINQWISMDALNLFAAIAYFLGGVGMLLKNRPLDLLENWKTSVFTTSFFGVFILQIGDKSQFIVVANAAKADHWFFPFIAAVLAVLIANIPAIIFKDKLATMMPLLMIRKIGGVIMIGIAILMGLDAFRLIA